MAEQPASRCVPDPATMSTGMKLYYDSGSCALSPHIVLCELGFEFDIEKVDLEAGITERGADFHAINPSGCVPVLVLDDGQILTEGGVIVQYLADAAPEAGLIPPAGTMRRYRVLEWLSFVSAELHRGYTPLFDDTLTEGYRAKVLKRLARRLDIVEQHLNDRQYLSGDEFTVADAYCFTILNWAGYVSVDMSPWPNIQAYQSRVSARPNVQKAMRAEGLIG
jgi:glutathione S-transferase